MLFLHFNVLLRGHSSVATSCFNNHFALLALHPQRTCARVRSGALSHAGLDFSVKFGDHRLQIRHAVVVGHVLGIFHVFYSKSLGKPTWLCLRLFLVLDHLRLGYGFFWSRFHLEDNLFIIGFFVLMGRRIVRIIYYRQLNFRLGRL